MIGRRATIGLSLLCALLFSAIAVQSAAAVVGTNTTAFACVKQDKAVFKFADAHCDVESVNGDTGQYEHSTISGATEIEVTNVTTGEAKSTQVLEGKPFKVSTKIECTTLTGKGTVSNSEPSAKVHKVTGSGTLNYSGCTVVKPAKCTVKEPIVAKIGSVEIQEGLVGPKAEVNAMGLEVKAPAGEPFTNVELQGVECPLKAVPFPVEGSVIVTNGPGVAEAQTKKWSGATAVVTPAMSNLNAAGAATYEGIATVKMKGGDSAAITATTVT
jgi:hypothetical protein